MKTLRFLINGSQPAAYEVVASRKGDKLTMTCECLAAWSGKNCKHRINLLVGDLTDLASNNPKDVEELAEMVKGTDIEHALRAVFEAEEAFEIAKKHLSDTKKALIHKIGD